MASCLIHHNGVFAVWSTIVDAAVQGPWTEEEARRWLAGSLTVLDAEYESIDSRIARARANGTTMRGDVSLADTVACNAMGPRGGRLSVQEVIRRCLTWPSTKEADRG